MPPKKGHKAAAKPVKRKADGGAHEDLDSLLDCLAVENEALRRQREHEEQRSREAQASAIARLQRDRAAMVVGGGCPERNSQLYRAAEEGRAAEVEKLLVDPFCDINFANHDGYTALYVACANGHNRVVTMLLEAGADAYKGTTDGSTCLHACCEIGHKQSALALLTHGVTPDLSMRGRENSMATFLSEGANVEPDHGGATPMQLACEKGFTEIVSLLLRFGADPNLADDEGFSPLYFAAQEGHDQCCALLLERGVNVDHVNVDGTTALCIAAKNNRGTVVSLLLRHGATVDLPPDCDGDTPLGVARMAGHSRVAWMLEAALAQQQQQRS